MQISKTMTKTLTGTLCLGVALSTMTGCGSSEPGDDNAFFLTLVGNQNVYLESGDRYDLEVRYHDQFDEPLAGIVDFRIEGQARGARLLSSSSSTDNNGIATVTLDAAADSQASFYIEASAPDAGTATWSITIEEPQEPLDPRGTYHVESSFDMVSGLEDGTVKDVVDYVIEFTDSPVGFLIQLLADNCDLGICDQIENNKELLASVLDAALKQHAPEIVNDILQIGEDLVDLVHDFGVVSTLEITGSPSSYRASHEMTGVNFHFGESTHHFTFSEMDVESVEASNLSLAVSDNNRELTVSEHNLPLSYGTMVQIALEQVVIRAIEGNPASFADFLKSRIDCERVGEYLRDNVGFIDTPAIGTAACNLAIEQGAAALMRQIHRLDDAGLELSIEGRAQPVSTNGDERVDVLRDGRWEGNLEYAGSVGAALRGLDNQFRAERVGN